MPLPTTSIKKSSKALVFVVVMKELVVAKPAVVVVVPVGASPEAKALLPFPICCPLKKILATLEASLVTVNVMAVFAVDCTIPAKRAAVGAASQVPGKGATVGYAEVVNNGKGIIPAMPYYTFTTYHKQMRALPEKHAVTAPSESMSSVRGALIVPM